MKMIVKEDGDGYLARARGVDNLFAYGSTKDEALDELCGVIDITMDYHQESLTSPSDSPLRPHHLPLCSL